MSGFCNGDQHQSLKIQKRFEGLQTLVANSDALATDPNRFNKEADRNSVPEKLPHIYDNLRHPRLVSIIFSNCFFCLNTSQN